jgi:hypothetical protein
MDEPIDDRAADRPIDGPRALETFHLGISRDGTSCLLLFIDEERHAIDCTANFAEFNAFVASLSRAAAEMSRRRNARNGGDTSLDHVPTPAVNVVSSAFKMSPAGDCILGSLIGDGGEVVGIRLPPGVANEMTRAILMASPAASAC